MESCLFPCLPWDSIGKRKRWTDLPKQHRHGERGYEPLALYEIGEDEDVVWDGSSWRVRAGLRWPS